MWPRESLATEAVSPRFHPGGRSGQPGTTRYGSSWPPAGRADQTSKSTKVARLMIYLGFPPRACRAFYCLSSPLTSRATSPRGGQARVREGDRTHPQRAFFLVRCVGGAVQGSSGHGCLG